MTNIPDVDIDIYSAETRADPYESYRTLRDAAPIVRLPRYGLYAMARFDNIRSALRNWQVFSSARGVAMNDMINHAQAGATIASDNPRHAFLRSIVGRPLTPAKLAALRHLVTSEAEALVHRLCQKATFDAATELAQHLPLTIVSELVGLPDEERSKMLAWSAASFNAGGPRGLALTESALATVGEMIAFARTCTADRVKPGSWVAQLYDAAEAGEIPAEAVGGLMNDYLGPALDTTIAATSNAIALFADFPDQWDKLRENPSLIPNAVNEVVRIESPIQGFSRLAIEDFHSEGQSLDAGSRVVLLYGSGNRDERHWKDPEQFDIARANTDQLGFGHDAHSCLGANLARLEISALLAALLPRVKRFEVRERKRLSNLVLRGYERLDVTAHPL